MLYLPVGHSETLAQDADGGLGQAVSGRLHLRPRYFRGFVEIVHHLNTSMGEQGGRTPMGQEFCSVDLLATYP